MAVRDIVQAAAGALGGDKLYVEDVFSTYLYAGTGSTQTITNGIDLDGEGGLVWVKSRLGGNHYLFDTERGALEGLLTNGTNTSATRPNTLTAFNTDGFTVGADTSYGVNVNNDSMASWTFRKAPKFFDVVTWVGDGTDNRQISHNLGSTVGFIITKKTSSVGDWWCYHRETGDTSGFRLNSTGAVNTTLTSYPWNVTDTTFTVYDSYINTNDSGATYVAYLFAHDAGGFGDDGEQNVISCGSYEGTGSQGNEITLGFEPQWLLIKNADAAEDWYILDNMRGIPATYATDQSKYLLANTAGAEAASNLLNPTPTGFYIDRAGNPTNSGSNTYIYIAIRRGPMKVPESGTEVFKPVTRAGTGADAIVSGIAFSPDLGISRSVASGFSAVHNFVDKLRGNRVYLSSSATNAEAGNASGITGWNNDGVKLGADSSTGAWNYSGFNYIHYFLGRAPGFFDVVCWSGTGANTAYTHNLQVAPELVIVKNRTDAYVGSVFTGFTSGSYQWAQNLFSSAGTDAFESNSYTGQMYAQPTSTQLFVKTQQGINQSGKNYVAYLFASCPGVSKVGSYTGTGTTKQIDCGFSAGARFVLIKRTDSTGDWYVWDSARGIVSGNDPYLLMNSTAAEVTSTDYIDPLASGFTVTSSAPAALNASGGSYIFLAIA